MLDDDFHSVQSADASQAVIRSVELRDGSTAHVAPLICYEDSLPYLYEMYCHQSRATDEPIIFVVSGNEALCRSSRRTHLQLVKMRAVEFGVPIVRAVNSGQSACVDGYGRIRLNLGESSSQIDDAGATGISQVKPQVPNTFYSLHRRHLIALYAGIIFVLLFCEARSRSKTERKDDENLSVND